MNTHDQDGLPAFMRLCDCAGFSCVLAVHAGTLAYVIGPGKTCGLVVQAVVLCSVGKFAYVLITTLPKKVRPGPDRPAVLCSGCCSLANRPDPLCQLRMQWGGFQQQPSLAPAACPQACASLGKYAERRQLISPDA